jgi:chromate transporter
LLAALYTPIWTSAVAAPIDVVIVGVTFALLLTGRAPPIAIVAVTALAGQLVEAV